MAPYSFDLNPKFKSQESDRQIDGHNRFISNCGNKKLQKDQRLLYLQSSFYQRLFLL